MTPQAPYKSFCFDSYEFDAQSSTATFKYSFDGIRLFKETVLFESVGSYNESVLEQVLQLAFLVAGVSYYKCYPAVRFDLGNIKLSTEQAVFFSNVYLHGLSQYVYENDLTPEVIASFVGGSTSGEKANAYDGRGISVLQSGGKDSLLLAELLQSAGHKPTAVYMQQGGSYPHVLDAIGLDLRRFYRSIDRAALATAAQQGALNGHVPVTFITLAYSLIDAVLHNDNTVLAAIGREGEEPHAFIGSYPVTHQWSKTWAAEQSFANYVNRYVSADIKVGSPLRGYSELKVAELFVQNAWSKYGHAFSSCNVANYKQGHDNTQLAWCGNCPKCANSYLLFAPFVDQDELHKIFGDNLFEQASLESVFKGLLSIDGYDKPFECIGEIDELRTAYWLAQENGYTTLPFEVARSEFNKDAETDAQSWAVEMIQ
jgi:UDP-N-acetyl-alpha-D-muramoyl-L-alanyl-L-glutamate epimerase